MLKAPHLCLLVSRLVSRFYRRLVKVYRFCIIIEISVDEAEHGVGKRDQLFVTGLFSDGFTMDSKAQPFFNTSRYTIHLAHKRHGIGFADWILVGFRIVKQTLSIQKT